MNIKAIFISSDEPRLRAGWRLLLQTLLIIFLALGFTLPLGMLTVILPISLDGLLVSQIVEIGAITGSVFIARRWLDRRKIVSLGLKLNSHALTDTLTGILITFVMMGLIYLIQWGAGWLTFEHFAWQVDPIYMVLKETLLILIVFVFVGWNEELLSRGYHLQTLESGLNTFWAVLLSSAVFGILHLGNPNATWIGVAGIQLAGIFLAYGYLRTRQLWLPIGLHIGWNFFEGPVFGFPVSGLSTFQLLHVRIDGPELLTGGLFGPEAGLVLIPGLIVGTALIYIYTRGRLGPTPSTTSDSGSSGLGDENNTQDGTDIPAASVLPE